MSRIRPPDNWTGTTPTVDTRFTSAHEILSLTRAIESDSLVVAPTSVTEYRALEALRDQRHEKLRLFYRAEYGLLIVTVPTSTHERLHLGIGRRVAREIDGMGLGDDWEFTGATTFRSALGSGSAGEGDSGGQPYSTRPYNRQWPMLVVEAGWTQTLESLRSKKDFWFKDSQHQVKIVILVKGYSATDGNRGPEKRILLEHWQERRAPERPGATGTRLHAIANHASICLQTINIVWAGRMPYHVANDAMR